MLRKMYKYVDRRECDEVVGFIFKGSREHVL